MGCFLGLQRREEKPRRDPAACCVVGCGIGVLVFLSLEKGLGTATRNKKNKALCQPYTATNETNSVSFTF